jgi:hypothetical protein
VTPEINEAKPVRAPEWSFSELAERLVETGVGHPLGQRLLVDIDLIAVLSRERSRITSSL